MNLKPTSLVIFSLFLTACTSNSKSLSEDSSGTKYMLNQLKANKAVVFVDVSINGKPCADGLVSFSTGEAGLGKTILSFQKQGLLGTLGRRYTSTKPGKFLINFVKCENIVLKQSSFLGIVSKKQRAINNAISPKFTVRSGEIFHIGNVNIVTVKRSTFFSDARGISVRKQTSASSRQEMRARFPSLVSRMKFTN